MDLGIAGRGCVVRGAARGLGGAVAELLRGEGASVLLVEDGGEGVLATAEERFGGVDVLVNAAAPGGGLDELTGEDWDVRFELGVLAPLAAMRAAAPPMAERGWGRIVNVCATAAELSLSRLFADRYASTGVLVNAVRPGPSEEETARAIAFLCSERASYLAGADWPAGGGPTQVIL